MSYHRKRFGHRAKSENLFACSFAARRLASLVDPIDLAKGCVTAQFYFKG
jgi:hypothetical protein